VHATDFEDLAIRPLMVFLISPGQVHLVRVDRPLRGYMLLCTADFLALDGIAADTVLAPNPRPLISQPLATSGVCRSYRAALHPRSRPGPTQRR
jgi:hypothetical protein